MKIGESVKFLVRLEKDQNGDYIRRYTPADKPSFDPTTSVYGDYVKTDKDHIQEAKTSLLRNMFDVLTELSKKDEFWIVRETDENNVVVAWKIEIIPMSEQR